MNFHCKPWSMMCIQQDPPIWSYAFLWKEGERNFISLTKRLEFVRKKKKITISIVGCRNLGHNLVDFKSIYNRVKSGVGCPYQWVINILWNGDIRVARLKSYERPSCILLEIKVLVIKSGVSNVGIEDEGAHVSWFQDLNLRKVAHCISLAGETIQAWPIRKNTIIPNCCCLHHQLWRLVRCTSDAHRSCGTDACDIWSHILQQACCFSQCCLIWHPDSVHRVIRIPVVSIKVTTLALSTMPKHDVPD